MSYCSDSHIHCRLSSLGYGASSLFSDLLLLFEYLAIIIRCFLKAGSDDTPRQSLACVNKQERRGVLTLIPCNSPKPKDRLIDNCALSCTARAWSNNPGAIVSPKLAVSELPEPSPNLACNLVCNPWTGSTASQRLGDKTISPLRHYIEL